MKIRRLFSREKIIEALKSFGALRLKISHSSLILASILFLILFIAFMIRILPLRWGFQLSEFDPYTNYRLTKHMVDNGFFAWASWHDYMSWYPNGHAFNRNYPGLAATAAFFYIIARTLGLSPAPMYTINPLTVDPVFNFCVVFPAIMGMLTCLVIYFLGKDIGGEEVGLFSALFLALNSSFIGRTSLGFFDDETVGIFGILLFIFFFLRAIDPERSFRNSSTYGVAAGLSLGYIFASWGAARYALGMIVLFVFVLLLLRRYSSHLLLSYSITLGVALFIAINVPKLGTKFLTESTVLAAFGIFLLLCVFEVSRYIKTLRMKMVFVFCFFGSIAFFFLILTWFGYISPLAAKYISVLIPTERFGAGTVQQLVQSVQEHRPAAWGSFYYDLGIGALLVPVGLYFAVQNPTNRNLFLCIFGLTSIYFASSMVRLTLLMAPAVSLLWALGLVRMLRPFITIMKETPVISRRKMRLGGHVGREFSGAFMLMTFLLLTFTLVLPSPNAIFPRVLTHAYSPTTIAAASMPISPNEPINDWIDTLNWMRVNLPPSPPDGPTVVAAWWDYGYWITTIANKTTLADNGTYNSTRIAQIGEMFLSNETEAIKILDKLGATHVVVFTTFRVNSTGDIIDQGWGDEGKWRWMARIAGLNETTYGDFNAQGAWIWNDKGQETVIYKLMQYGKEMTVHGTSPTLLEHFKKAYFSRTTETAQEALNKYGVIALVCVYEIEYV